MRIVAAHITTATQSCWQPPCYFVDCNEATSVKQRTGDMSGVSLYALTPDNADQLWEESLRLLA